jgi:ABC-type antimicrobial peptide transport system permease subunit
MAVNELAADILGVDVGDVVSISTMTPEQVRAEEYFPPIGPRLIVQIVGVMRGTDDLAPGGANGGAFVASEAWLPTVHGEVDEWTTYLGIGLVPGASSAEFERVAQNLVPPGQEYEMVTFEERSKAVRGSISTLSTGLAMFAIVAGAAAAIIVGQAVSRHVAIVRTDEEILGYIGLTRADRRVALVLTTLPVAVGGAGLATFGSWGASSMVPLGLARRADPDPGRFIDWLALGGGAIAVVAVVVGAATLAAAWMTRSRPATRTEPPSSKLAESVFRAGGGPVLTNGVRLALDRRSPGLPVRSALAGVALALAGVFGALTFSSSLDRLSATPERWGYGWDLLLNFTSSDVDSATEGIVADDRLTAVARWDAGLTFVDGSGVQAFGLTSVKGDVGYSLRSGRQPLSPAEVVLGSRTADRLGIDVGEQANVANSAGTDSATSFIVVGTAIFPDDGEGSFNDAIGFYGDAFAEQAIVPDLFEASQLVVRVAPGQDIQELGRSLNEEYPGAVSSGENLPLPPAQVANLTNIRSVPAWLAAFVVLLGVASLLHVLLVTVWRRRSELAVLRSIGLTPRQTAACLIWQALTITGIGLVVGVPLGLVMGNAAWFAVARPIGVATDADPPLTEIGFAVLVSLAVAVLLAVVPGCFAARARPAQSLRVE